MEFLTSMYSFSPIIRRGLMNFDGIYMSTEYSRLLTRVNSANVLDEELRIGGRGRRINSKVKVQKTRRNLMRVENKLVDDWLNLNLSLAGLSWPLYIGGQFSRIRSDSIQIIMPVYDVISYFDYIYVWA
jgi:hypothetical protein